MVGPSMRCMAYNWTDWSKIDDQSHETAGKANGSPQGQENGWERAKSKVLPHNQENIDRRKAWKVWKFQPYLEISRVKDVSIYGMYPLIRMGSGRYNSGLSISPAAWYLALLGRAPPFQPCICTYRYPGLGFPPLLVHP